MIKVYDLTQCEQWDRIVKSFQNYDTYWLSGYVKAFKIHGDGSPFLIFNEREGVRGINVVLKRDIAETDFFQNKIPEGTYYDISSPYGYGGWIIDGSATIEFFEDYKKWCVSCGIISEFVRFHPVLENHKMVLGEYDVVPLGNTVVLDISSEEIIWNNIHSKNRNMIRKAKKNGVKVYFGRYPEIYKIFQNIYNATMDKDKAEAYYYFSDDFYKSVLYDLPNNALVFYAVYEEKVIAATIILASNHYLNYHLSGSVKEFSSLAPTNLLLYEVALWGNTHGYKSFYLGGGVGSGEDSLYKFKKSFYKPDDTKRFYIGKLIFDQKKYDELVKMRGDVQSGFFPKYRA